MRKSGKKVVFNFAKKKGYRFIVSKTMIAFDRPYRSDKYKLSPVESRNIHLSLMTFEYAQNLWGWHHCHGLQRKIPHPLGIPLSLLLEEKERP